MKQNIIEFLLLLGNKWQKGTKANEIRSGWIRNNREGRYYWRLSEKRVFFCDSPDLKSLISQCEPHQTIISSCWLPSNLIFLTFGTWNFSSRFIEFHLSCHVKNSDHHISHKSLIRLYIIDIQFKEMNNFTFRQKNKSFCMIEKKKISRIFISVKMHIIN